MRRAVRWVLDHLTYANVVATLALFIALGGASYAAIALPAHSVGPVQLKANAVTPRALGFSLGVSSGTEHLAQGARRNNCNHGSDEPGRVLECTKPGLSTPEEARVRVQLRSAGRLLISGVIAIANRGSTTATVRVGVSVNEKGSVAGLQVLTVAPGQTIEDPVEAVVSASAGEHLEGLAREVQYAGPGTGEVFTGPSTLAVTALPSGPG